MFQLIHLRFTAPRADSGSENRAQTLAGLATTLTGPENGPIFDPDKPGIQAHVLRFKLGYVHHHHDRNIKDFAYPCRPLAGGRV